MCEIRVKRFLFILLIKSTHFNTHINRLKINYYRPLALKHEN